MLSDSDALDEIVDFLLDVSCLTSWSEGHEARLLLAEKKPDSDGGSDVSTYEQHWEINSIGKVQVVVSVKSGSTCIRERRLDKVEIVPLPGKAVSAQIVADVRQAFTAINTLVKQNTAVAAAPEFKISGFERLGAWIGAPTPTSTPTPTPTPTPTKPKDMQWLDRVDRDKMVDKESRKAEAGGSTRASGCCAFFSACLNRGRQSRHESIHPGH